MRTSLSSRRSNFATTQHFCPILLAFITGFAVYMQQFVVYMQRFCLSEMQGGFSGFFVFMIVAAVFESYFGEKPIS